MGMDASAAGSAALRQQLDHQSPMQVAESQIGPTAQQITPNTSTRTEQPASKKKKPR